MRSPVEGARHILGYYRRHSRRPGDVLRAQSFKDAFAEPGWKPNDFPAAMDYAVDRGWVEANGAWYALTEIGVRAYRILNPAAPTWGDIEFIPDPPPSRPPPRAVHTPAFAQPTGFGRRNFGPSLMPAT